MISKENVTEVTESFRGFLSTFLQCFIALIVLNLQFKNKNEYSILDILFKGSELLTQHFAFIPV